METDQPIIVPIIVAIMGLLILINNKRFIKIFIESKEKHVRGKELNDFEKAYVRFGVFAAGIFGLGMGIYLTVKALIVR